MRFDSVVMVDWSGGNDRGPRPCKDAIWIGEAGHDPVYCRNRQVAEDWLTDRLSRAVARGERLMVGFDFPFGYPQGVAQRLSGGGVFDLWNWIDARIEDSPKRNNRFDMAGQVNLSLGGGGPFWGHGLGREVPGLARNKSGYRNPFPDRRRCEDRAKGAFTVWQLAYAGAVGSQVLMGLPVLNRLRSRFPVAIWPFEAPDAPILFTEIWPGLIDPAVRAHPGIRDAVQVRLLADGLMRLHPDRLGAMVQVDDPLARSEEGWILGLGHEEELLTTCR